MSEIIKEEGHIIVKPGKDVVALMANDFRAELYSLIKESSCDLTIDLTGVEMVDSIGIGVMIAVHNSLNNKGKKLKVINITEEIEVLFNTMTLGRHFTFEKAG